MKYRARPKDAEVVEAVQLVTTLYTSAGTTPIANHSGDWFVVGPGTRQRFMSDADFRAAYEEVGGTPQRYAKMSAFACCDRDYDRDGKCDRHPRTGHPWCPTCERPMP